MPRYHPVWCWAFQPNLRLNTATPPYGHPFKLKGNFEVLGFIPLQHEGVARSDGVAASKLHGGRLSLSAKAG